MGGDTQKGMALGTFGSHFPEPSKLHGPSSSPFQGIPSFFLSVFPFFPKDFSGSPGKKMGSFSLHFAKSFPCCLWNSLFFFPVEFLVFFCECFPSFPRISRFSWEEKGELFLAFCAKKRTRVFFPGDGKFSSDLWLA